MVETAGTKHWRRAALHVRLLTAACGGVLLFVQTSALAFRSTEDSPEFVGKGPIAWESNDIAFALSDRNLPAGLAKTDVEKALVDAMDSWASPACSKITLTFSGWTREEPAPRDGQNIIGWVENWANRDLPASAPASTDVQFRGKDASWRIAEADVYLDALGADWGTDGATSVLPVLTHELGHALGLLHPCEPEGEDGAPRCDDVSSDVEATTMYPFYDAAQASLSDDDIAGLCYLYPNGQSCGDNCGPHEACVDGECRSSCGSEVCRQGEVCGAWGCADAASCLSQDCTGTVCDDDIACGPLANCKNGKCTGGSVAWGDRCSASPDCARGACVEGVCQPACVTDTECGLQGKCLPNEDGRARGCTSSRAYELGSRCAVGEDCASGICVFAEGMPRCTTECKTDATCPKDWSCNSVEERNVCVPPSFAAGGGCRVSRSPTSPEPSNQSETILVATVLLATLLRRRKMHP